MSEEEPRRIDVSCAITISWSPSANAQVRAMNLVHFGDVGDLTPVDIYLKAFDEAIRLEGAPRNSVVVLFYQMMDSRPLNAGSAP